MTTLLRMPRHKLVAGEVRAALARADLNQTDLARHLGVSNAAASELCRGIVPFSLDRLDSIAEWLDVRLTDLLGDHAPRTGERRASKLPHLDSNQKPFDLWSESAANHLSVVRRKHRVGPAFWWQIVDRDAA